jgi:hypothetical protein
MLIAHNVGDLIAVTTHFDRNARDFVTTGGKDIFSTIKEAIVLIVGQENHSKVKLIGTNTEIWVLKSYICHNITQMEQKEAKEEYINNFRVEFDTNPSSNS